MAVTVGTLKYPVEKVVLAPIAFDASYPTGGEQITAKQFGLASFTRIEPRAGGSAASGLGYVFYPIVATDGLTANLVVAEVSGGALVQVANTTDLSALTAVPFSFYGY